MSNLFESISIRTEQSSLPQDIQPGPTTCEASAQVLHVEASSSDIASKPIDAPLLPKKDLLSFLTLKCSGGKSVRQDSNLIEAVSCSQKESTPNAVSSSPHPTTELTVRDTGHEYQRYKPWDETTSEQAPNIQEFKVSSQVAYKPICHLGDCLDKSVKKFLDEEYGSTCQTKFDLSAVLSTALAYPGEDQDGSVAPAAKRSAISIPSVQAALAKSAASSKFSAHHDCKSPATTDVLSNDPEVNLISAVQNFSSTSDQCGTMQEVSFSAQPIPDVKPSKIEFSVSQSASSYHKWKSSVSVPDELVKKLPKPVFQPRLPPELAQGHSGPHVLKSSLNIDFKKQATTKAELRFNSFASDQDGSQIAQEKSDPPITEKPPVKLVIKTLSRESKPQRVVIISCSSSVRREPSNRPNDDSDPDSCGHHSTANASSRTSCSVSLPVPQEEAQKSSDSGQTGQQGKEHTKSIYFCSMQPSVKVRRIDTKAGDSEPPARSFSLSPTWSSLQELFSDICKPQQKNSEPQTTMSQKSEEDKVKATELKRLSDSFGYCAFANIPNKREATKIAALYHSTLIAHEKNLATNPDSAARNDSKPALGTHRLVLSSRGVYYGQRRKQIGILHKRVQIRTKFRRTQIRCKLSLGQNGTPVPIHPLPTNLDPLVAASFDRMTGEPTVDHLGRSSLHIAMGCHDETTLSFVTDLYKRNSNLDCKDSEGLTPLLLGCREGNFKAVQLLLIAGASASNTCPDTGNTPLHEAVLQQNFPLVKLLLRFGADVTSKNNSSIAAVDLKTSSDISEELNKRMTSLHEKSFPIRILHSDRRLPTVYALRCPSATSHVTHCVLKSELCNSLGVSPEYFNVHHSSGLKIYVLENSAIASRIINPQLASCFELSMLHSTSSSSTLVEVNDAFTSLFDQYTCADRSRVLDSSHSLHSSHSTCSVSSHDTDEMIEELSEEDECEIRKNDVKETLTSLEKLTTLSSTVKSAEPQNPRYTGPDQGHVSTEQLTRPQDHRIPHFPRSQPNSSVTMTETRTQHSHRSTSSYYELGTSQTFDPNSEHTFGWDTFQSDNPKLVNAKIEAIVIDDDQEENFQEIGAQFLVPVNGSLASSSLVPESHIVNGDHNGISTEKPIEIDLDSEEHSVPDCPATRIPFSRRKTNPLIKISKETVQLNRAAGDSASNHLFKSTTASDNEPPTLPADHKKPPVPKLGVMPCASTMNQMSLMRSSHAQLICPKILPCSRILSPSAIKRVLTPSVLIGSFRDSDVISPKVISAPKTSFEISTSAKSTNATDSVATPVSAGDKPTKSIHIVAPSSHLSKFDTNAGKVFVKGAFKPVQIVDHGQK